MTEPERFQIYTEEAKWIRVFWPMPGRWNQPDQLKIPNNIHVFIIVFPWKMLPQGSVYFITPKTKEEKPSKPCLSSAFSFNHKSQNQVKFCRLLWEIFGKEKTKDLTVKLDLLVPSLEKSLKNWKQTNYANACFTADKATDGRKDGHSDPNTNTSRVRSHCTIEKLLQQHTHFNTKLLPFPKKRSHIHRRQTDNLHPLDLIEKV